MKKKDILLAELEKIEKENGSLTPSLVVDEARSVGSPLHDYFEWDDGEAGEAYRIWQARSLIGTVKIEFRGREVQKFHSVSLPVEFQKRGYVSIEKVVNDKAMRKQVLEKALAELEYWRQKYSSFTELFALVDGEKLKKLKKAV